MKSVEIYEKTEQIHITIPHSNIFYSLTEGKVIAKEAEKIMTERHFGVEALNFPQKFLS